MNTYIFDSVIKLTGKPMPEVVHLPVCQFGLFFAECGENLGIDWSVFPADITRGTYRILNGTITLITPVNCLWC